MVRKSLLAGFMVSLMLCLPLSDSWGRGFGGGGGGGHMGGGFGGGRLRCGELGIVRAALAVVALAVAASAAGPGVVRVDLVEASEVGRVLAVQVLRDPAVAGWVANLVLVARVAAWERADSARADWADSVALAQRVRGRSIRFAQPRPTQ